MKYKIAKHAKKFVPFDITFTIETEAEATILHDKIACEIAESSQFVGDCYRAIVNSECNYSGDVPLVKV